MLIRVILITAVFAFALLKTIAVPMLLMLVVMISFIVYHFIRAKSETNEVAVHMEEELKSPFEVLPAMKFALLILLIKFLSAIGVTYKDVFDPQILYYVL